MAFTHETLVNVAPSVPSIYLYMTNDTATDMAVPGYFNRREIPLNVNDTIMAITRASGTPQVVTFVVDMATASFQSVVLSVGGGGVTGLTNPLLGNLIAAGFNVDDLGQVTFRDAGGGVLTLANSPTGGLLVNGAPIASDLVGDTTPQLGGNLDGQNFNVTNLGTINGRNVALDGTNQDALQTLMGLAAGTTILPATTDTVLAPANLVTRFQDIATALLSTGSINSVAAVSPVAGDIPLAALITALGQDHIQNLLGVAAGTNQLPAVPAGTGVILNAGTAAAQIAELKSRIDAGGGSVGGDLTALEALTTIGIAERTAVDTWVTRAVGLLVNNLVARSLRGGIEFADTAGNGQKWWVDEETDNSLVFRYGATDGTATARFTIPPGGLTLGGSLDLSSNGGANVNTAAVTKIDIDGTRATLTESATAGEMNLAFAESLVMRGDYNATTNNPDLTTATLQVQGDAYRVSVDGNQDIGNGAEDFSVDDIVYRHTDGTWRQMRFRTAPGAAQTGTTPAQTVSLGASFSSDPIPFPDAISTDHFAASAGIDIGFLPTGTVATPHIIQATAHYQADGFVRIIVDNLSADNVPLPAINWTIYKVNESQAAGAGGGGGSQIALTTPFTTSSDLVAVNTRDAVEEVKALAETPLSAVGPGAVLMEQTGGGHAGELVTESITPRFIGAGDGLVLRMGPFGFPVRVVDCGVSVDNGESGEFSLETDTGPGTTSAGVPGISDVAFATLARTSVPPTTPTTIYPAGAEFVLSFSNTSAAIDGTSLTRFQIAGA